MNCVEFNELIDEYIDSVSQNEKWVMQLDAHEQDTSTTLTKEKIKEFEEHMESCPKCKAEFTAYQKMINSIHALKPEKLPDGYCKRLNAKLNVAKQEITRKKRFNYTKYFGIAAAFILVIFTIFAFNNIGSKTDRNLALNENSYSAKDAAPLPEESIKPELSDDMKSMGEAYDFGAETYDFEARSYTAMNVWQTKIIKSGSLYVETEDFDNLVVDLNQLIKDNNGYIENSEISIRYKTESKSYRYADFNFRVPQESFDNIIQLIEVKATVNRKNINEDDVTKSYYDKQNILTNLEIQENRLRELYDKADNITDILALENEIRRIRTEIDAYSIDLRDIDDRVNMSTIKLSVTELGDTEISIKAEDGLWTRAKKGFIRTTNNIIELFQSFVIWIISYILVIIPLVIIGIIIYRHIRKRKRSKM